MCRCLCSVKAVTLLLLVAAAMIAFEYVVDQPHNFVFDPIRLQQIAQRGIAKATTAAAAAAKTETGVAVNVSAAAVIAAVISEAKAAYPQYVSDQNGWLFNNAGGAMGSMTVLHSSFSEYLIIFGTAVGTEGHTGRFIADDYFTIIYGEQWAYPADVHEKEVYRPGDQHHLVRYQAKQYRMPDACWAIEYARGNIPSMLFFGFADILTSTLDVVTLWQTVEASAKLMLTNLMNGKI